MRIAAEIQRNDAERIACADKFFVGQANECVGALKLTQPLDETIDKTIASRTSDEGG